jgi:hypothetical protein
MPNETEASPRRAPGKLRARAPGVIGAFIGVAVVLIATATALPGWGPQNHTECRLGSRVGNFTVWLPSSVVAAPYLGNESGKVEVWTKSPGGFAAVSFLTNGSNGNVTAWIVGFENWTVFETSNLSVVGSGPDAPCSGPLVAHLSASPPKGETHGGTTLWPIANGLVSDVGLPGGLNGSAMCSQVENNRNLSCGVGARFDMNFTSASGVVDTCGSSQPRTLSTKSDAWPVRAPFVFKGVTYSLPVDLSATNSAHWANGTTSWYNYTFPANTGTWTYDNLTETSATAAGLVFSYSPCP